MKKSPLVVFVCVPGVDPVICTRTLHVALCRRAEGSTLGVQSLIRKGEGVIGFWTDYCDLFVTGKPSPDIIIVGGRPLSMDEFDCWKQRMMLWPTNTPARDVVMYLVDQVHSPAKASTSSAPTQMPAGVYLSFLTSVGDPSESCVDVLESIAEQVSKDLLKQSRAA